MPKMTVKRKPAPPKQTFAPPPARTKKDMPDAGKGRKVRPHEGVSAVMKGMGR